MSLVDDEKKGGRISKEIVEKIKKSGVKMKSPYYFIFFSFLWFGLGAFFFGIAFLLLAFSVHYLNDYEFFGLIGNGHFSWWAAIPFVCIIFSIILIYVSSRFYRKGRICCRHEDWMLLSVMGLIVLVGLLFLAKNDSFKHWREKIEDHCILRGVMISARSFWSDPKKGRIFGEVVNASQEDGHIFIESLSGDLLKVDLNSCNCKNSAFELGEHVKIIGKYGEDYFQAKQIWNWE